MANSNKVGNTDLMAPRTEEIVSGQTSNNYASAWTDIRQALRQWPVITMLGTGEIVARYRQTLIGQFWITLSTAILIAAVGLVWSHLWNLPVREFLPYFAAGQILWIFLTSTMTDASVCFLSATAYLKEINLPRSIYIFSSIVKNLIIFSHNIVILPIVFLLCGVTPNLSLTAFPLAVLLTAATVGACSFWLAILGLRFRDVPNILSNLVAVMFFLTPVIWKVETIKEELRPWLLFNPFHIYLELMRGPLLGYVPTFDLWLLGLGILLINVLVGFLVFSRFRKKITYWL